MKEIKKETIDFDESKVNEMYMKLKIDMTKTLDIGKLGKDYVKMVNAMENESYSTTVYVNR